MLTTFPITPDDVDHSVLGFPEHTRIVLRNSSNQDCIIVLRSHEKLFWNKYRGFPFIYDP